MVSQTITARHSDLKSGTERHTSKQSLETKN